MKRRSHRAALFAIALPILACSDDGDDITGPSDTELETAVSRIAVALVAVAAGDEGSSFLDNFLPCTRRGIINYANTKEGRLATLSGCRLGSGVTIDGAGEVRWVGPDLPASQRAPFCVEFPAPSCETALAWSGVLNVTFAGGAELRLEVLRIDDLMMAPERGLYPENLRLETGGLGLVSLGVTARGETFQVDGSSLPGDVFGSGGLDIHAIPNPSGSLDAFTTDDAKRLAYDPALALFGFLVNEISEVRGDHTHDLECGTSSVTFDQDGLPLIQNDWSSCETLGVFLSGTFSVEFGPDTDFANGPFTMLVEGELVLGGGVPKIDLARMEWSVMSGASTDELRVTGELETPSGETRTFDLTAMADD